MKTFPFISTFLFIDTSFDTCNLEFNETSPVKIAPDN